MAAAATTDAKQGRLFGYGRATPGAEDGLDRQVYLLRCAGVAGSQIHRDVAAVAASPATKRPGFDALWGHLRAGDTVVVPDLSRLGRSLSEVLATVEGLRARGARLRALAERIDSGAGEADALLVEVLAGLAGTERRLAAERTAAGQVAGRAAGKKPGRKPVLTADKAEEAVRRLNSGEKPRWVAKALGVGASTLYGAMNDQLAARLVRALPG